MPILAYLIASNEISISQISFTSICIFYSFLFHRQDFYRTLLCIWVTRRVSYMKQGLFAFQDHLSSPPVCYRVHVVHLFSFLFCPIMCHYVLNSVLWCLLQFPHKMMFGSSLPPVVCVMTHVLYTLFMFVWILIISVKWWVSYKRQEMLALRENLVSPPIFGGVHIAQRLGFLYRAVFLCFVCLRRVSCVPNVASVSGLFILECAFCFL